jgi:hypothetical protein
MPRGKRGLRFRDLLGGVMVLHLNMATGRARAGGSPAFFLVLLVPCVLLVWGAATGRDGVEGPARWAMGTVGILFGAAGVGFTVAARRAKAAGSQADALKAQFPGAPWKWRPEWH